MTKAATLETLLAALTVGGRMNGGLTKVCTMCNQEKPANNEHFSLHKHGKYGLNPRCKLCVRDICKKWAQTSHGKEYQAKYRAENAEKIKSFSKQWMDENREHVSAQRANYRKSNRDKLNALDKAKREKNPDVYAEIRRRWKRKHLSTARGRILNAMHVRISAAIKGNKGGESWFRIVGYTYEELHLHLERQFTKDMSWENYGTFWHIDHIVPVAAFDFDVQKRKAIRDCWALSNLRPLCAIENSRKRHLRLFLV